MFAAWQRRLGRPGAVVLLVAVASALAPLFAFVAGHDPSAVDPDGSLAPPSLMHWLGTDELGRDVLFRTLYGARVSLGIGVVTAAISIGLGGAIGLWSGYRGGLWDAALMRVTELAMAIPKLPVMLIVAGLEFQFGLGSSRTGASILTLIVVIGAIGWMRAARIARASAREAAARTHVEAARALGLSDFRIVLHHVFPAAASGLVVAYALSVADVIFFESALSFLGLGVQPPTPSWGGLLRTGFAEVHRAPQLVIVPGVATFLTIAAIQRWADRFLRIRSGGSLG